jgi:hypothetical protein
MSATRLDQILEFAELVEADRVVAECFGGSELFGEPLGDVEGALVGGFGLGPVALCPVHVTDLVQADRVVAECFGGSELFGEPLDEC